jgi:post-segregation antitoxin (ccd killing protein)
MSLAQQTDILLLDELTTFLDINHQIELLDLLTDLNRSQGTTIVIVLHDLNLAFRYADHVIAMKNGGILRQGPSRDIVDAVLVRDVFGLDCMVVPDPLGGAPMRAVRAPSHVAGVCILVCMARLNVYVPDDLAERARARGLNVSALTQAAISAELENSGTDAWLDRLEARSTAARHDDVMDAIDAARDEFGA